METTGFSRWSFILAGIYLFVIAVLLVKAQDPVGEGENPASPSVPIQ